MDDYFPLKLKRKDLEDVNDDFSDFSLSSPARKIRRLDAELPPIKEEEESDIPMAFEPLAQEHGTDSNPSGGLKIEELPNLPDNEERAIVLFKPINTSPLSHSPSNFSVSVNPDLISGLKNQVLLSGVSNSWRPADDEAEETNNSGSGNGCLAVVPWVPSQMSWTPVAEFSSQVDNSEMMDAQEVGEATMEVEDGVDIEQRNVNEGGGVTLGEGFNQWQQPHCLIPQPPHNTTTPIVWYR
ncbi:hypothetical protein CDL12_09163 [Handroanthus impetiginosus]|uniref:Uncharacterized protein n=1 Tax=Handroanthus impetiginosus TaxID=429701 RepID=A0A2G9HKV6_9LAMI|nr:hypothetical protein CDL12_09163 [Handroanthus impetiginosus]